MAQRLHPITGKPFLQNEDGSFSTEETTTIQEGGRWINIPTIVNGERLSEDAAVDLYRKGENPSVGEYDTLIEAEAYAKERSALLGRHAQPLPSVDSTVNFIDESAINAAEFDANVKAIAEQDAYSWAKFGQDLIDDNTTVNLARGFMAPGDIDDPDYTDDHYAADFAEMQKMLPEDWWGDFYGIGSHEEFQRKFANAKARFDAQQRYASQGWLGFSAKLLSELVDPTNLAIGFGVVAPAFRIAKSSYNIAKLGQIGGRAVQAGIGAAAGVGSVAAYDASGGHPAEQEYLYAAALGAALGGAFGPLAQNPSTADIAEATVTTAQSALTRASRAFRRAAEPPVEPRTTPLKDVPEAASDDAERVVAAAIRVGDRVYTGPNHILAIQAAQDAGEAVTLDDIAALWKQGFEEGGLDRADQLAGDGFVTSTGRYVSRREADTIAKAAGQVPQGRPGTLDAAHIPEAGGAPDIPEPRDDYVSAIRYNDLLGFAKAIGASTEGDLRKAIAARLQQEARKSTADEMALRRKGENATGGGTPFGVDGPTAMLAVRGSKRSASRAEPVYRPIEQLEDLPADTKNPRYVARYRGADDNEYVIRATADGDAISGPYEVLKKAKDGKAGEFIARDIEGMRPREIAEKYVPREVVAEAGATPSQLPRELPNDPAVIQARLDEIDAELAAARAQNDDGALDDVIDELRQEATDLEDRLNELEAPDGVPANVSIETIRERVMAAREQFGDQLDEDTLQQVEDFISAAQQQQQIEARNAAPVSAGAAANTGPIPPTFADSNPGLRALRDEDVPYPAKPLWLPRFDISGVWGNTRNAAARLINRYLYNDPVGYSDHSVAVPSADLTKARYLETWMFAAFKGRATSYNKWAKALGYSPAQRFAKGLEYRRLLSDAVEAPEELITQMRSLYADRIANGTLTDTQLNEAMQALLADAEGPRAAFRMIIEKAVEAKIPGAEEAAQAFKDGTYLPHAFSWRNIVALTKQGGPLGGNGLERLVYGAIRDAQPTLNDHYLNRLAKGYTKNIVSRAYKTGEDEWTIAMRTGDRDRFVALLREDTRLSDTEIDEIMQHIWDLKPEASGIGNLKSRVLLNPNYVDADTGLAFKSVLERDFDQLFMPYANRFAGRTALAEMKIRAPVKPRFKTVEKQNPDGTVTRELVEDGFTGGDVIFDGIKSDADLRRLLDMVDNWGAEYTARGGDNIQRWTERDIERMKWGIERILGYPDPAEHTNLANYLRAWRDFQHSRLMWQGGVAQLGESGNVIGTFGLRTVFSQVPSLRDAMKHSGDPSVALTLRDELHELGIGAVNHHNLTLPQDSADGLPFNVEGRSRFDTVRSYLSLGPKITNKLSLQHGIQRIQEVWTAKLMAQKIADAGYKLSKGKALGEGERRRFAQLTLSEDQLTRIFAQLKEHTSLVDATGRPGKVASLSLRNWTDLEARTALEEALYRSSKKMIQSTNLGNMAVWMTKPVAKAIFQFRQFTFTAWANSLLYNLHMGDFPAVMSFVWSLGVAGAVRGAQVYATASLMEERQGRKYRERNLTTDALLRGAFQRTSQSSIIPSIADTAWLAIGQKPLFDARFSGQPTDFITGSVPFTYANTLFRGVGGLADAALTGRRVSQAELKAFQQIWPLATFLPWQSAWSHMIRDFPERAPRLD